MIAVLIPVGGLGDAKSRLAAVLDADARRALSLAMLDDVVSACRESSAARVVTIVTSDKEALSHARALGIDALPEPASEGGLNGALTWALSALRERAAEVALILPADIPLARADDIDKVVHALGTRIPRCVVVPARDGGTNALAMRPPGAVPLHYGPGSAAAHLQSSRQAGAEATELHIERFAFDVDTPDDLALLPALAVGEATARWLATRPSLTAGPGR